MKIIYTNPSNPIKLPSKGRSGDAGWDIYMPTSGTVSGKTLEVPLGFAIEIPTGYCALIMPRSGVGTKHGLELNNTVGLIDSNYRGEWKVFIRTKDTRPYSWEAGDRLLQFIIIPHFQDNLELVDSLTESNRNTEGFGSSGT